MAFNVKRGLVLGLLMLGSTASFAGAKYGMAGCGLGSIIFKPNGSQSSAATSNGLGSNQLFGITAGTSNCKTTDELAVISKQEDFVAVNLGTLSKEMAQGSGESIAALSETLGCESGVQQNVAVELKANYHTIFKAPGAMAVLDTTKNVLKGNPSISSHCQYLN